MKKLMTTILLLSLTLGNNSFAEESVVAGPNYKVILLEQGAAAPFQGYLFPKDKALDLRKELIELDTLKALEKSYIKSIDLYILNENRMNEKINILLEHNDKLASTLAKSEDRDAFENKIWFAMGILVTGLAVYGAGQLSK